MNQENNNQSEVFAEQSVVATQGMPKKKQFYKKWWFWAVIVAVVVAVIASMGNSAPDLIDLPESEYKAQCQSFTYDEIARNPDNYEKKLAKFTGEVVQVIRDGNELQMRVDVTETKYGFYEDTVYVFYTITNNTNVLEGDIITMYGELRGSFSFSAMRLSSVVLPEPLPPYRMVIFCICSVGRGESNTLKG